MKKKIIISSIIILLIVQVVIVHFSLIDSQKKKSKELLDIAENIISDNNIDNQIEIVTNEELEINNNVIGIVEIPKIGFKAPIVEGTSQDKLKTAVGHFENSSFWNGNVALASHNRGSYVAHYFEKLGDLQNGDEITYKTKLGERMYLVKEKKIIESTDWSIINQTKENRITLVTCVKNQPKKRLCVIAYEKI